MKKRTFLTGVLCVVVCFTLLFSDISSLAAIFAFETQYDNYEAADKAWLTDLVVQEDMSTVSGMTERNDLIPQTVYPYSETPSSFKNEIAYYCELYTLDEDAHRAAYLYFLELLGTNSEVLSSGLSDDEIKEYLEQVGVVYPELVNADELIIAKALYVALITGTFTGVNSGTDESVSLEEALVAYVSQMTGIQISSLQNWLVTGEVVTLNDYILAASKLSLWTNGYDVSLSSTDEDVYKMMAVMTMEQLGIAVSSDLTFEELKLKYMAAMLGSVYEVTVDCDKLSQAFEEDSVAFYILQLLGQKAELSIREDNCSYADAFYLVAQNTDVFNLDEDEFYADINKYSVSLKNKRDSIWVYPTAYVTGDDSYIVHLTVDGLEIKNNYYNEVALDSSVKEQTLELKVVCFSAHNGEQISEYTYYIIVYQGEDVVEEEPSSNTENETFLSSDSIVSQVLNSLGLNVSIGTLIDSFYSTLSSSVAGVVSLIAPTFGIPVVDYPQSEDSQSQQEESEIKFISILDRIGAVIDTAISGIGGINLYENYSNGDVGTNFITFD